MELYLIILLLIGVICIVVSLLKSEMNCPPSKIIYKYIPMNTLDVQFSESENTPSKIFNTEFTQSSPWIGGYTLGSGGKPKTKT